MRFVSLLILATAGFLQAQDGAALYKERCASCHDLPTGRIPPISAIQQMTASAIYAALTNGAMQTQAAGLSTQEVLSLIVYIAPVGDAAAKPVFEKNCAGNSGYKSGAGAWGGWSPGVTN